MIYRHLLLATGIVGLLAAPALAQSAGPKVSVIRGIDANAPVEAGVTVIRGEPGRQPEVRTVAAPAAPIAVAGDEFWLYDPEKGRLTACNFRRGLNVGAREIRCFSRSLK